MGLHEKADCLVPIDVPENLKLGFRCVGHYREVDTIISCI